MVSTPATTPLIYAAGDVRAERRAVQAPMARNPALANARMHVCASQPRPRCSSTRWKAARRGVKHTKCSMRRSRYTTSCRTPLPGTITSPYHSQLSPLRVQWLWSCLRSWRRMCRMGKRCTQCCSTMLIAMGHISLDRVCLRFNSVICWRTVAKRCSALLHRSCTALFLRQTACDGGTVRRSVIA